MGGTGSTRGRNGKYVQHFGRETSRKFPLGISSHRLGILLKLILEK
jgi:hypothetical protein